MKTTVLKPAEVVRQWWLIDATDQPVGRLAARLAPMLVGKHRPDYTPHVACGDFLVVINAEKVRLTGKKWSKKTYSRYTGYPSGLHTVTASELREKRPDAILRLAVERMLPKNKLGHRVLNQLKLYVGPDHPHQAQQPKKFEL
jgi:large subunit ribosomal protein L13